MRWPWLYPFPIVHLFVRSGISSYLAGVDLLTRESVVVGSHFGDGGWWVSVSVSVASLPVSSSLSRSRSERRFARCAPRHAGRGSSRVVHRSRVWQLSCPLSHAISLLSSLHVLITQSPLLDGCLTEIHFHHCKSTSHYETFAGIRCRNETQDIPAIADLFQNLSLLLRSKIVHKIIPSSPTIPRRVHLISRIPGVYSNSKLSRL